MALGLVIVVLILLIVVFWFATRKDPFVESFHSARRKINNLYAYDDYQNSLLSQCLSRKHNADDILPPETQAKLISIREINKTLRQQINDLDGAILTIYTMPDRKHRIAIIHSALDKLWNLQCQQDRDIVQANSFKPQPIQTW